MENKYNLKSPAVKRLMKEAAELREPTEHYHAQPLEENLFEWHFSVRGPPDSDFDGGVYHGRIVLPPEYPMKPPSIILLTPNGRFEVGKKICLSISGHHPETWQPSWSIRTALIAIIGFMPTKGEGAIGSLDYTPEERKALAKKQSPVYPDRAVRAQEQQASPQHTLWETPPQLQARKMLTGLRQSRRNHLQFQEQSNPLRLPLSAPSAPGNVEPSVVASSPPGSLQPTGQPLCLQTGSIRMKATRARPPSFWCSLWPWLCSFSAESTWHKSTSLTTISDHMFNQCFC
uniref:UBC core domain-containing protein n=1 Tax=Gouania willdenowi TaxID=441366 RepID=A0A8C5I606_GOUWI